MRVWPIRRPNRMVREPRRYDELARHNRIAAMQPVSERQQGRQPEHGRRSFAPWRFAHPWCPFRIFAHLATRLVQLSHQEAAVRRGVERDPQDQETGGMPALPLRAQKGVSCSYPLRFLIHLHESTIVRRWYTLFPLRRNESTGQTEMAPLHPVAAVYA